MRYLILFCFLAGFFFGCKKSLDPIRLNVSDQEFIQAARAYMDQNPDPSQGPDKPNPRTSAKKTPEWEHAAVVQLACIRAVLVPVHYAKPILLMTRLGGSKVYAADQVVHLLIFQDSASLFEAELITALPDSSYIAHTGNAFRGLALVEHWNGGLIARYLYNDQATLVDDPEVAPRISAASTSIQICNEIDGYNYSPDDPDGGESWSETGGCSTYFLPTHIAPQSKFLLTSDYSIIAGGGGGGTPPSPAANFQILSGNNPISDIEDYIRCFTYEASDDHQYQVTVCVAEPEPGTREPWGFEGNSSSSSGGNPFNVGHTFLVFTERYGSNTITRNLGFYPQGGVNPFSPVSQGQLNNNASSDYDISLTITVNNIQFLAILNYMALGNNPGFMYDLNSNNCTSMTLDALSVGGINLPSTIGTWLHGSGNDPGDLGEDIRHMTLLPNMTRNTIENPHPNVGICP